MGCMVIRRTKSKIIQDANLSLNLISLNKFCETIESSLNDSSKLKFVCRKFKIPDPEPKIYSLDFAKLYAFGASQCQETGTKMTKIVQDSLYLASTKSYFYTNLHYACIPEFTTETGLSVFVIFCQTQNFNISVTKKFPFIEISDPNSDFKDFCRSWSEFVEMIFKLNEEYRKMKYFKEVYVTTQELISRYSTIEDAKAKKKVKYFKELLNIYDEFIRDVKEIPKKITRFAENFEEIEEVLKKIAKSLQGLELKKCEKLVHLMF
jgi:hypothetical protein